MSCRHHSTILLLSLAILLGMMAGYSSGSYCVCQNSVTDQTQLQSNIDYACGDGGANCTSINPGGACYEPQDIKAHCDYAVNYYYQLQGQVNGSCDFSGTATVTQIVPAVDVSSPGCSYPASPSQLGTSTPATATTPSSSTTTPTSTGAPSSSSTFGVPIAPTAYDNTFNTNKAAAGSSSQQFIMSLFISIFLLLRG